METFLEAYIMCALWSETEDDGTPLDRNYSAADLAPSLKQQMADDCSDFEQSNAALLEQWYSECGETIERAGHDFWLTRNRHGAGFWDRWASGTPQGKIGGALTEAAHAHGEFNLYVGDDGLVYGG